MAMAYQPPLGSRPAYLDNLYRDAASYRDHLPLPPHTPPASLHSYTSSISTTSTASTFSLRSAYHGARPLSPPIEECTSDSVSIRSKKSFLSPKRRFRFGTILPRNRHTYPQAAEEPELPSTDVPAHHHKHTHTHTHVSASPPTPPASSPRTRPRQESLTVPPHRRPSLPRLQTTFPPLHFGPPEARSTYERKALPALPDASQPPSRRPSRLTSHALPPPMKRHASAFELHPSPATDVGCQKCYYFTARNCNGYVLGGDVGDACETCLGAGFFGAT